MRRYGIHIWQQLPFVRLLVALCAGILAEYYLAIPVVYPLLTASAMAAVLALRQLLAIPVAFHFRWINGIMVSLVFAALGCLLMRQATTSKNPSWVGLHTNRALPVMVSLAEPLSEKPGSFKAVAAVQAVRTQQRWVKATGNIIIYFKKDSMPVLEYGTRLVIQKKLEDIRNSTNPGAFDYRGYCVSQDIFFQVYLKRSDYVILNGSAGSTITGWLFRLRDRVLQLIRMHIPGTKEPGVAEALLIGYRNDLDKPLVQAYSHTGVVHIIAISGLHLGMIYGLLLALFRPFAKRKYSRWLKPVVILLVLWGFCLLTGAAASILRSAVMFSFIILGDCLLRKTRIYNTLAASAFCLLVYNPWFLWYVGFQLSYTAVLGILLFMKPVYRLVYCRNKLLDAIWQLNTITLSAQVFTLPLILFYFHQFPNLFLFTNFIAVPLSGVILYGELLLVAVSPLRWLAACLGRVLSWLICIMNGVITRTDSLSCAVSEPIYCSLWQCFLLLAIISCLAVWVFHRRTRWLVAGLAAAVLAAGLRAADYRERRQQRYLIVYDIRKKAVIDIVDGTHYREVAGTGPQVTRQERDFHLKPSRIYFGVEQGELTHVSVSRYMIRSGRRKVVLVTQGTRPAPVKKRWQVDVIVMRGNQRAGPGELAAVFDCPLYVFDADCPLWKIRFWKKEADNLHLRHHSVPEQGAFVMDL